MHVRIKPYNKRRGHRLRSYTIQGRRFTSARGWYEVPTAMSVVLADIQQVDNDEHSPMAFDVVTAAEARKIDEIEATDEGAKRAAADPDRTVLTSDATPAGRRAKAAARASKVRTDELEAVSVEKDERIAELEAQLAAGTSEDEEEPSEEDVEKDERIAELEAQLEASNSEDQEEPSAAGDENPGEESAGDEGDTSSASSEGTQPDPFS